MLYLYLKIQPTEKNTYEIRRHLNNDNTPHLLDSPKFSKAMK